MSEILTLANLLSISRIPLGIWLYLALSEPGTHPLLPAGIMILAGITDYLDGLFARLRLVKTGKQSRWGEALDPLADKILAIIVIIGLIQFREFPIWMAGLIIGRDILIITAASLLLGKSGEVKRSNLPGKYYFASLAILLSSYLLGFQFGINLYTYLTFSLWLWSTYTYSNLMYRALSGKTISEQTKPLWLSDRMAGRLRTFGVALFSIVTLIALWREYPFGS